MMNRRHVPVMLTVIRLLAAPVMLGNAWTVRSGPVFLICLSVGFLSDIFDGVLARRLGVASAGLRRFDSVTDVVFYVAALSCIWIVHSEIMRRYWVSIVVLAGLEVVGQGVSLMRFGRVAAVHAYSAKVWGIFLFAAVCGVLGFGVVGWVFIAMLVVGFVAYAEWLGILVLSGEAVVDVGSVFVVWRRAGKSAPSGRG